MQRTLMQVIDMLESSVTILWNSLSVKFQNSYTDLKIKGGQKMDP